MQQDEGAVLGRHSLLRLTDDLSERAVLGAILIDKTAGLMIADTLAPADFFFAGHTHIYDAMQQLINETQTVDEISLVGLLRDRGELKKCGGERFIFELSETVATASNALHHAQIVKQKSTMRRVAYELTKAIDTIFEQKQSADEILDEVERSILQETSKRSVTKVTTPRMGVMKAVKYVEELRARGTSIRGIPSGLVDYDAITKGWVKGTLNIVAGRPGMGKSSFAVQCAQRASIDFDAVPVVFSLEMRDIELFLRMMANEQRIDGERLLDGKLRESEYGKLTAAASAIQRSNVHVVSDNSLSVFDVRAQARRLKSEIGANLFIVDYIQRMKVGTHDSHERAVAEISGGLKALAQELDVPVIALSQLNRGVEQTADKRPSMAHLLASGAIEADADTITLLYRENFYKNRQKDEMHEDNVLELMVEKNRNGRCGNVEVRWDARHYRIDNLQRSYHQ